MSIPTGTHFDVVIDVDRGDAEIEGAGEVRVDSKVLLLMNNQR